MLTDFRLTDAEWNALHIPIGMAFLFHSTPDGRPIALYPGPGTTESVIGGEAWSMLILNNPELADLAPDVEALLVNRTKKGLSVWSILVFPALFTVGMSLIDTTGCVLMLGAYGNYARIRDRGAGGRGHRGAGPHRRQAESIDGPFWAMIGSLNDNFGVIGYVIIGIFVLCWIVSFMIYRAKRYDGMTPQLNRRRRPCHVAGGACRQ